MFGMLLGCNAPAKKGARNSTSQQATSKLREMRHAQSQTNLIWLPWVGRRGIALRCNGDHSLIAVDCGILWRLFLNGLMPPNKYKTIRMRRCHLKLAANFGLYVSYFLFLLCTTDRTEPSPRAWPKRIKSQPSNQHDPGPSFLSRSNFHLHLQLHLRLNLNFSRPHTLTSPLHLTSVTRPGLPLTFK